MNNRPEGIQSFLVITISFLLVVWPAYLQYNDLIELDVLSPNSALENFDPDNLLADKHDKTNLSVTTISPPISFFIFFWVAHLAHLSFQICSPDQPFSVLRC
jgi:hypothetical protein